MSWNLHPRRGGKLSVGASATAPDHLEVFAAFYTGTFDPVVLNRREARQLAAALRRFATGNPLPDIDLGGGRKVSSILTAVSRRDLRIPVRGSSPRRKPLTLRKGRPRG